MEHFVNKSQVVGQNEKIFSAILKWSYILWRKVLEDHEMNSK